MNELWAVVASQPEELQIPTSDYLRLAGIVKTTLSDLGTVINRSSRLVKYEDAVASLFRSKFTKADINHDTLWVIARAFSELRQLAAIASYARAGYAHPTAIAKAQMLLQDAALPASDRTKATPGRDVQFELFVAACWSACGFPCKLREPPGPDFTLALPGFEVGLEAKRIKSITSFEKRLAKANGQNSSFPGGGVVVTDLSPVIMNDRPYLRAASRRDALSDLERRLKHLMSLKLEPARRKVDPGTTFGWVGYCDALYLFEEGHPSSRINGRISIWRREVIPGG